MNPTIDPDDKIRNLLDQLDQATPTPPAFAELHHYARNAPSRVVPLTAAAAVAVIGVGGLVAVTARSDGSATQPAAPPAASQPAPSDSQPAPASAKGTPTSAVVASLPEPIATPDSVERPATSDANATTTTQFASSPVHEWVRGQWEAFSLKASVENLLDGLDRGELDQLLGVPETCAELSSVLAERSSIDAVIPDQEQRFADVAATCASIAASLASDDEAELAINHASLVTQSDLLADIFLACDELMIIGDANEPAHTGPLP